MLHPVPVQSTCSLNVILIILTALPLPPPSPPRTPRQDLIADLKSELMGKFERLIVNLMRPLAYCDAKEIKDALSVRSVSLSVLGVWVWLGEDSSLYSKCSVSPTLTMGEPCSKRHAQTLSQEGTTVSSR